ncbi:MAG: outer membrane beta-barrel family protein [Rikenellaceae bacterium]
MKRIKLLLLSALTMVGATTYAADREVTISGAVKDGETAKTLPYATVQVVGENGKVLAGGITTDNGTFSLKCDAEGDVKIEVSFVGYKDMTKKIYVGELNDNYAVGALALKPSSLNIGEVTVKADAPKVSASLEKQSFALDKNVAQSGGSVLKAISNLPGVTVDGNGSVSLRGSDNVLVLIDGKQSSLTGFGTATNLDNISASNVEKIEIINNPSAKYDSKGNAGIINIVYKENLEKGFNGEVGLAFGIGEMTHSPANLDLGGIEMQDKYAFTPKLLPNVNVNYRSDKINYFLNAEAIARHKVGSNVFTDRYYDDGTVINQQFSEMREQIVYDIKSGLDWYISDADKLTVYGLWHNEYHFDNGAVPYDYNNGDVRMWNWREDEDTWFMNGTLLYTHNFDEAGHTLEFTYNFTGGREDELFPFSDKYYTNGQQVGDTKYDSTHLFLWEFVHNYKLDYVRPLSHGRLESGLDFDFHHIPIDYFVQEGTPTTGKLNPNLGNWSDYQENVYAAYLNYVYESKHTEIEAGVRLEETTTDYILNDTYTYYPPHTKEDYLKLYPSARFTYKIDQNNRLSLFYNKRVDRPSEFDLRPFPKYDEPEVLRTGNPTLAPQFTDHVELAYKMRWEGGFIYAAGYYKWIENSIYRVAMAGYDPQEPYLISYIPQNFGDSTNAGFEITAEQKLTYWWSVDGSFNWYKNTIEAHSGVVYYPKELTYSVDGSETNTWNAKANTSVDLENGLSAQLSFIYNAADITPVSSLSDHYSLNFGVSYPVIKGAGEIYCNATDILNTDRVTETIHSEGLKMVRTDYLETQTVTIGFKYKF